MFWTTFFKAFSSVFLAELGDKTQIATLALAAAATGATGKWAVLFGASLALVLNVILGVLAGSILSKYVSAETMHKVAGVIFIVLGTLYFFGKA